MDIQFTADVGEGRPVEHLTHTADGDRLNSNSDGDNEGTDSDSIMSSELGSVDGEDTEGNDPIFLFPPWQRTQSSSDSSIMHEMQNASLQRRGFSGMMETSYSQNYRIVSDAFQRIPRSSASENRTFHIISLQDLLCRRGHALGFLRALVICISAVVPLLLEICSLKDLLSQFLDRNSWILVRAASNPTLLKSDIVVPIPHEILDSSMFLANRGLCFGESSRYKLSDSATMRKQTESPKPDRYKFRIATSPQLRHGKTNFGIDASKRFDVVLIITGKRKRQKQKLALHYQRSEERNGTTKGEAESVKALYTSGNNENTKGLAGEKAGQQAIRHEGYNQNSTSRKARLHIRGGEEPIACPIRLPSRLCESKIFLQALKNSNEVCQPSTPDETVQRLGNSVSWNDLLLNMTFLYWCSPLGRSNSRTTQLSNCNARRLSERSKDKSMASLNGPASACSRKWALMFASQLQCVKPVAELENFSELTVNLSGDAGYSFHGGEFHRKLESNPIDRRPNALPYDSTGSSVVVFLASSRTDDVSLSFLFRFVAVVFVFGRWIVAEMRMVMEVFLPPVLVTEVIRGCILIPFRTFKKYADFYLKFAKRIGSQGFKMVFELFHWLDFRGRPDERAFDETRATGLDRSAESDSVPTRLGPSEILEIDLYLAPMHALWRSANFCLHYIWATIGIICLQCMVTDGVSLQWRAAEDSLTISELCVVQKLAWFVWASVIATIHLYNNPFLPWSTIHSGRIFAPLSRAVTGNRLLIHHIVVGIRSIVGAYSVATIIALFSLGLLEASIWHVSLFTAFSCAETLLRSVLRLDVTRTRGRSRSRWLGLNLVDGFHSARLPAEQTRNNQLLWRVSQAGDWDDESVGAERELGHAMHAEPLGSVVDGHPLDESVELLNGNTGDLGFIGIPRSRRRYHSHGTVEERMSNEFLPSQTTRTARNELQTKLFIVEKTGFNYFKLVDPAALKLSFTPSRSAGTNWRQRETRQHPVLSLCYVCMCHVDDAVLIPCMHGGICLSCGRTILLNAIVKRIVGKCPLCRTPIYGLGQVEKLEFHDSDISCSKAVATSKLDHNKSNNNHRYSNGNPYQLLRVVLTIRPYRTQTTTATDVAE